MQPIRLPDTDLTPQPESAPLNRAERRGKAKNQAQEAERYHGSAGHARPAQGRRINPIRRTG
jgi:hypothetical protein